MSSIVLCTETLPTLVWASMDVADAWEVVHSQEREVLRPQKMVSATGAGLECGACSGQGSGMNQMAYPNEVIEESLIMGLFTKMWCSDHRWA